MQDEQTEPNPEPNPEWRPPAREDNDLQIRIEEALAPVLAAVTVTVEHGVATLQGVVPSAREKARIERLVRRVPGLRGVESYLDVDFGAEEYPRAGEILGPATDYTLIEGPSHPEGMEPDFADDIGTTDVMRAVSEAEPYFPPTDPVVEPTTSYEGIQVLGGFAATSADTPSEPADHPAALQLSDDEIAEDVRLALRQDAGTTDLLVDVRVRRGVAVLRGTVNSLEDTELAMAVASRVPGVRDVVDELSIAGQP
ncbi:MAG: BON domain-containing protein [Chloroflexi bacterium]|nr:BON domain-containing protein [Chloroflexota bacterium]